MASVSLNEGSGGGGVGGMRSRNCSSALACLFLCCLCSGGLLRLHLISSATSLEDSLGGQALLTRASQRRLQASWVHFYRGRPTCLLLCIPRTKLDLSTFHPGLAPLMDVKVRKAREGAGVL